MSKAKKANKAKLPVRPDSPVSRMDDACYSPDPLTQYLNRKAYHSTYLADIEGSNRIDRRIAEENS